MPAVELFMYDLSRGMAASLGPALLGRPVDGIWHTSVVVFGTEFFFSGGGIERATPRTTYFGQPMRVVPLGTTEIPRDLFESYLDEISPQFAFGSYHMLDHNCNTFSHTVAQFLVGRGIPSEVVSMPADFINSPLGRMVLPHISSVARSAPRPSALPLPLPLPPAPTPAPVLPVTLPAGVRLGEVNEVATPAQLQAIIDTGRAVVVDFTSPRCGPCVAIAPYYAQLAAYDKYVVFVSVNTLQNPLIAMRWAVHATPTFLFFHAGQKVNEVRGADRTALDVAVGKLAGLAKQVAPSTTPAHPHDRLDLPTLRGGAPALMTQGSPAAMLQKLKRFLAESGHEPAPSEPWDVLERALVAIQKGAATAAKAVTVVAPADASAALQLVESLLPRLKPAQYFPALDVWRLLVLEEAVSARLAGAAAESRTIAALVGGIAGSGAPADMPAVARMMALRVACNMFGSSVGQAHMVGPGSLTVVTDAIVTGLLGSEATVRETAAALAYNVSLALPRHEADATVEIVSAVQHAVQSETSPECVFRLLAALGRFAFGSDDTVSLLVSLDARETLLARLAASPVAAQAKTQGLLRELALVLE